MAKGSDDSDPVAPGCADGLVRVGERCVADAAQAHVCAPKDEADCETQCEAGNLASCYNLGLIHDDPPATGLTPEPRTKALSLFRRACDGGIEAACVALGDVTVGDAERIRQPPLAQALDQALPLYERACTAGVGRGCARAAWVYGTMRSNPGKAMAPARQDRLRGGRHALLRQVTRVY